MNIATLWVILFFISLIGLIIGLAKPSILENISKDKWSKKKVIQVFGSAIFISLVLITVAGSNVNNTDSKPQTHNSTSEAQEAVKSAPNTPQPPRSIGYGLAKLHAGSKGQPEPDQALVVAFEQNLKVLNEKCTEDSEEQIADMIVTSQRLLKEKKNVSMDLTKVGIGLRASIPDKADNLVSCAEIAALFVTLTDRP